MNQAIASARAADLARRNPPLPPPMNAYRAAMIADGVEDADYDEHVEAWQFLHDTGLAYQLQGRIGRTARDLIEQGVITE